MDITSSDSLENKDHFLEIDEAAHSFMNFSNGYKLVLFGDSEFKTIKKFEEETARVYGLTSEIPLEALILQYNLLFATAIGGRNSMTIFFGDTNQNKTLQKTGLSYCHPLNMLATIGHMVRFADQESAVNLAFSRKSSGLSVINMKDPEHLKFKSVLGFAVPTQEILKPDISTYLNSQKFELLSEFYQDTFHIKLFELIEMAIKAASNS